MYGGNEIMAELRRVREEYAAKFNYDMVAMYHDMKKREQESGREIVSFADEGPESAPCEEVPLAKAS